MSEDVLKKQQIEVEFWKNSLTEAPESTAIENIVNKMCEAKVFLNCLSRHKTKLALTGRVLELGAGQGWASCFYKRQFPAVETVVTDISPYAIQSVHKWERILECKIDQAYACKAYETREDDSSVDQIFCFAAAHHFLEHKKTIKEIARILKPGGRAFYFQEPCTSRLFYKPAYYRVNRKRPEVPEDLLITEEIKVLAANVGLNLEIDYNPSTLMRGAIETMYFFVLGRLPFLQDYLPATAHFIFEKV